MTDRDELFEALAEAEQRPLQLDAERAVSRLRAHGLGAEADALLVRSAAWHAMLLRLRDVLRRFDPAWCALNDAESISDEDLDLAIAELEDLLEVRP